METPRDESQYEAFRQNRDGAYSLAAGLLWQDRKKVLPLTFLLALPGFVAASHTYSSLWIVGLEILSRAITLFVLFLIGSHLLDHFGYRPSSTSQARLPRLLIGGFVFWVLFALPLSLLTIAPETLGTLALFLLMPAIILSLRFYFYFFPILIGHTSPKTILGEASEYTKFDSFLGLKALIGPLGFMLVIVASIRSFSSEETNLLLTLTVEYLSTIFPLLTIYLGMSFCLTLLPEKKWSAYGLTPYHRERFETLRVNSPKWLSNILRPQTGLFFLVIGSLLWLSNDLRTSQMPPSAKIQVLSVSAKDSSLTLELSIDGEKDANTLSFHPGSLRLAAEKGSNISQQVPEILFQGEKLPFGARLDDIIHGEETKTSLPVILTVTFETQLSEKELTKLGDMYLWYRNYRMDHILVPTEELPSKDGA